MDHFFEYMEIPEERKVKLVIEELLFGRNDYEKLGLGKEEVLSSHGGA